MRPGAAGAALQRSPPAHRRGRWPLLVLLLLVGAAGAAASSHQPNTGAGGPHRRLLQAAAAWSACGGITGPGGKDAAALTCTAGHVCKRDSE
jgi:hypothetical protein